MTDRQQYPAEVRERAVAIVRDYLGQSLFRVVDDLALRLAAAEAELTGLRRLPTHGKITEYTVCVVPGETLEAHAYAITVAYTGGDRWAVRRHGRCLNTDSSWDWERKASERDDDWLAAHRFDHDTALRVAAEHAPNVTINGVRAADLTEGD